MDLGHKIINYKIHTYVHVCIKKYIIPPKTLAEHSLEDPDHPDQGGVQPGVLPVDGDDEEVDVVAGVAESEH